MGAPRYRRTYFLHDDRTAGNQLGDSSDDQKTRRTLRRSGAVTYKEEVGKQRAKQPAKQPGLSRSLSLEEEAESNTKKQQRRTAERPVERRVNRKDRSTVERRRSIERPTRRRESERDSGRDDSRRADLRRAKRSLPRSPEVAARRRKVESSFRKSERRARSPRSVERRPPSVERRPPSVERRPPSVERRPSSVERRPSSVERRPPSVERRPPSVERRTSSVERRSPSVERRRPRRVEGRHDVASLDAGSKENVELGAYHRGHRGERRESGERGGQKRERETERSREKSDERKRRRISPESAGLPKAADAASPPGAGDRGSTFDGGKVPLSAEEKRIQRLERVRKLMESKKELGLVPIAPLPSETIKPVSISPREDEVVSSEPVPSEPVSSEAVPSEAVSSEPVSSLPGAETVPGELVSAEAARSALLCEGAAAGAPGILGEVVPGAPSRAVPGVPEEAVPGVPVEAVPDVPGTVGPAVPAPEADTLDSFMAAIVAEVGETFDADQNKKRRVRRKKAPTSISLEEILALQQRASAQQTVLRRPDETAGGELVARDASPPSPGILVWEGASSSAAASAEVSFASAGPPESQSSDDVEEERYRASFVAEIRRRQKQAEEEQQRQLQIQQQKEEREQKLRQMEEATGSEAEESAPPGALDKEERWEEEEEDYRYSIPDESESVSYFDLVEKVGNKKELPAVDHSTIDYPPFRKNLYIQVREITLMKDHEVEAFRRLHGGIRVRGKLCPRPVRTFFQCGLPDVILKMIERREYEQPFPIQMQALPALMAGRDVMGVAETGSGKTLAYLLPLLRHILHQPPLRHGEGPIGLVLAPTRELAVQIQREADRFCKAVELRSVAVYGGTGIGEQLSALKRGAEMIVATPGRLIDVLTINAGKVTNLQRVTFCVLDEADRMFDLGFEPQITSILRNIRPDRQTALFSATFPPHIEALARKILKKPVEITVGEKGRTASRVEQVVEVWPGHAEKFLRLLQLLGEWHEHGAIIIFVSRQAEADELFVELLPMGYSALVLHGGQDQTDRDFTIRDFKDGVKNILIATSVAARGLDVKSVVLVVNFVAPDHLEDYVHRIGRTGRAGNIGVAYTFVTPQEAEKAEDLIRALTQAGREPPAALAALAEQHRTLCNAGLAKPHKGKGFGGKGFKFTAAERSRQQQELQKAKKDLGLEDAASDNEEELGLPPAGGDAGPVASAADAVARAKALLGAAAPGAAAGDRERRLESLRATLKQRILTIGGGGGPGGGVLSVSGVAVPSVGGIPGLSPVAYIDPATGNAVDEFDINDYPQVARYKITHRDVLARLSESSGAALQVKGLHVPPEEAQRMAGVKRLYVEIIGATPVAVQRAKHEIRQLLEQLSLKQLNSAAMIRQTGRYSVV